MPSNRCHSAESPAGPRTGGAPQVQQQQIDKHCGVNQAKLGTVRGCLQTKGIDSQLSCTSSTGTAAYTKPF